MTIDRADAHSGSMMTQTNPDIIIPAEQLAQIDALDRAHAEDRDYQARHAAALRPTPQERAELAKAMGELAPATPPGLLQTVDRLTHKMWARAESISLPPKGGLGGLRGPDPAIVRPIPPVDHRFWWYRHVASPDVHGLSLRSAPQGIAFTGLADHSSGDYDQFDLGLSSTYGLEAARRQYSPTGWYRSAPRIDLSGYVEGTTRVIVPDYARLPYGDDWCTCVLTLRQTIYQFNADRQRSMRLLGENMQTLVLFSQQNESIASHSKYQFPGQMVMPEVCFEPGDGRPIQANLDVRFTIIQEGVAQFAFRRVYLNIAPWAPEVLR